MIGVFDSGFGGLTILKAIRTKLPQYDYLYVGDNARAPYGTRSFELIYQYTWQAVQYLFAQGCTLVILACNTASAKALRSIQQRNLPQQWQQDTANGTFLALSPTANRRVLGVIRPTVEILPTLTKTKHIGLVATQGTVLSNSYPIEIQKIDPTILVQQQTCPLWVPLIENNEHTHNGADYFVKKYLDELFATDTQIDTLLLACTHYPLLLPKIAKYTPQGVNIVSQGTLVADSLADYLKRHSELEITLSKNGTCRYRTTESADRFDASAGLFLQEPIHSTHITL